MKQTFQVMNVKCEGCASTLKEKLFDQYGEVEVNLDKNPREIILDVQDDDIASLGERLKKLGYPFITEKMGFIDSNSTKAKSFISCAIGKINT
ncbi:MAG: heavy-metal-associated domain-containing protein [Campylobacterota bacterium]|nr:heavy-metal-associated domain-containing protein [Campylobacterota bacterium]